jgi:hypothetical protein
MKGTEVVRRLSPFALKRPQAVSHLLQQKSAKYRALLPVRLGNLLETEQVV